jgi:hypothetical protein
MERCSELRTVEIIDTRCVNCLFEVFSGEAFFSADGILAYID